VTFRERMGAIELRDLVGTITVSVSENGKGECKCSRMREFAWILRLRGPRRISYILAMFAVFVQAEWKTLYQGTFLTIKPTRRTNFSNLFLNETVHVSDSSSVHHQEFFAVHTAIVHVIQVCSQLSANLYNICQCCMYSEKLRMMDRGTVRNM